MTWRFTLIDYTFNPAGDTTLVPEPEGWNGSKIVFERDRRWHGVDIDYILGDLGFHGQGFTVISDAYTAYGIHANTSLLVEISCVEDEPFETFYEGTLDYSKTVVIFEDNCRIFVGARREDCMMKFLSRYDQKVNLESLETFDGEGLNPYAAIGESVEMPIKDVLLIDEGTPFEHNYFFGTDNPGLLLATFQHTITKEDFSAFIGLEQEGLNQSFATFAGANNGTIEMTELPAENCIGDTMTVKIDVEGSITIDLPFGDTFLGATPYTLRLYLRHTDSAGVTQSPEVLLQSFDGDFFTTPMPDTNAININTSNSFLSVANGDKFFFVLAYQCITAPFISIDISFDEGSLVSGSLSTLCDVTEAKVFLINEALSRTAEIITDDCYRIYSEYFGRTDSQPYDTADDGCGSNEFITNGLLIRRATLNDGSQPLMSVSMKDLFDGLNAIHAIGMGTEDDVDRYGGGTRLRIERFTHFYDDSAVVVNCENVKEIKLVEDSKLLFSNIEVGYKKWESEDFGGRDDMHSKRIYRTEQSVMENTLNIQSAFIASNYSMEITRRLGTETTDWKYDNDIFIFSFLRTVYGTIDVLNDFTPSQAFNMSALFYFNQRLTPVRNLMRWFKIIGATWAELFLTQIKQLKFTSGEGNYIAQWRKTSDDACLQEVQSVVLAENQDLDKTDFKDYDACKPVWLPRTVEYEYPLSFTQFKAMRASPYQLVQFNTEAYAGEGYIDRIEYDPNKGIAKWKLIQRYTDSY